ncbi:serine/threonine protein kinase [Pannus brasiliensis CCIBt3594]|uniref:non-specific serine/threonine protein kinase n=1 Tax=Pannus brasiliensis CCIBt3594 TaxID=1427578 RepID=A0AAW9R029_9CHRO
MDSSTEARSAPTVLNERYHILRVLGEGGFGTTYLAEDHHLPSRPKRVIKQLKPVHGDPAIQQIVLEKFEREAVIQEELSGENERIPKLYAYFVQEGEFYLVEEYIEGDTLTRKVANEGLLSEDAVRRLLQRILPIIEYIHDKNIIYRDIKPDNIILRRQDGQPVLIDFGAVRETMGTLPRSGEQRSRTMIVGTEGFSSPEQSIGRPVFASDIYSLGVTAIFLLTGQTLTNFESDPRTGLPDWRAFVSVTPAFAETIEKAIAINPLDRYQNAAGMMAALETLSPARNSVPTRISSAPPTTVSAATLSPSPYTLPTRVQTASDHGGEWKKAVIIGGLVGCSILASTFVIRTQLIGLVERNDDRNEEKTGEKPAVETFSAAPPPSAPSPVPARSPVPSAVIPPPQPSLDPSTNATIAGQAGRKNIWSGPGLGYGVRHRAFTGDRVRVLQMVRNGDNFPWYEVFFPTTGARGWIAGNLLAIDGQGSYVPRQPPARANPSFPATNATVSGRSGTKNMRSGPGTAYGVVGQVPTGARVKILDSGHDRGGYLWYNVPAPSVGRSGWIAAQLIARD